MTRPVALEKNALSKPNHVSAKLTSPFTLGQFTIVYVDENRRLKKGRIGSLD